MNVCYQSLLIAAIHLFIFVRTGIDPYCRMHSVKRAGGRHLTCEFQHFDINIFKHQQTMADMKRAKQTPDEGFDGDLQSFIDGVNQEYERVHCEFGEYSQ